MRRIAAAATVAVLLLASPGEASTFVALTSTQMVSGAESIIQGRVVSLESKRSDDGRLVVTDAVIRVRETLVGDAPEFVTVRTVGGRINDFLVEAPGFPSFEPRERVILFLEPGPGAEMKVRGYQQGHFEVVRRNDGVRLAVPRIEEGVQLITRDGVVLPEPRSMPLGEFKQNVRRLADQVRPQR